jgi:putative NADH-flavin reductase
MTAKDTMKKGKHMNEKLKIVVIVGSGLIGTKLVKTLRERGHEVVPASPSSGVNTIIGEVSANSNRPMARAVNEVMRAQAIVASIKRAWTGKSSSASPWPRCGTNELCDRLHPRRSGI